MIPTRLFLCGLTALFIAAEAGAQQRPIFDPDDFVDPRDVGGETAFISRIAIGGAANAVDDYRPVRRNIGFIHLTNSIYWPHFQFDYKHSEIRGDDGPIVVQRCGCNPPIYFPTPPSADATPAPPPTGSKDTLQAGLYWSVPGGSAEPPVMLRVRLSVSRQHIGTVIRSAATDQILERRTGHEQSVGLDTDTYFRLAGHNVWGSLFVAHTGRSGTTDNRSQNEFAYMSRFPGRAVGPLLVRATLTVGAISNRGGTGLNLVNPAFEAFWHHHSSRANVHLVYSPQATRSGLGGWETHHQIALFVDRALKVKLFGPHR